MTISTPFATIRDNFELLDSWEDRYAYLLELGNALAPVSEEKKTEQSRVRGCVSQVWLVFDDSSEDKDYLHFRGDSDSHLVRGIIAIVIALYQSQPIDGLEKFDPEGELNQLGLREHLTPQRSNGLSAMLERIRSKTLVS